MKKYCLSEETKEQLKDYMKNIGKILLICYIFITMFGMIVNIYNIYLNYKPNLLENIIYYNGFIGWIVVIVLVIKELKKWLRKSIVLCNDKS